MLPPYSQMLPERIRRPGANGGVRARKNFRPGTLGRGYALLKTDSTSGIPADVIPLVVPPCSFAKHTFAPLPGNSFSSHDTS